MYALPEQIAYLLDPNVFTYFLLGLILILAIWIAILERKLRNLLKGKDAKTLEDTINSLQKDTSALQQFQRESIEYLKNIEARLRRSLQAVETVRFNPFKGTGNGGNQSFSTAFLNERGDGVVFSSLHARDRVSIFSKPVKKFSSEFEATDEEREAINASKNALLYQSAKEKNK